MMNNQANTPQPGEARFSVRITMKNILGKTRIDFELFRTELDEELICQVLEAAGYNSNHPRFGELKYQVKKSFTLDEIDQFIAFISSQQILELNLELAVYRVNDITSPNKGRSAVAVSPVEEIFDFSTLEGYAIPFVIKGRYNPLECS
jgi:hypothetical protein